MNWILKHLKITIAVLALGALGIWGELRMSGYCFDEGRYLSDDELIRVAVSNGWASWSYSNFAEIPAEIGSEEHSRRFDSQVDKFIAENPKCCQLMIDDKEFLGEGWFGLSLWGRITGSQTHIVEIRYTGEKSGSRPRHFYRTVGSCGKIYDDYL